jgi:hypothetical protein
MLLVTTSILFARSFLASFWMCWPTQLARFLPENSPQDQTRAEEKPKNGKKLHKSGKKSDEMERRM